MLSFNVKCIRNLKKYYETVPLPNISHRVKRIYTFIEQSSRRHLGDHKLNILILVKSCLQYLVSYIISVTHKRVCNRKCNNMTSRVIP